MTPLWAALMACASGPLAPEVPVHEVFSDLSAAMERVFADKPLVVGLGELHAKTGDGVARSTLARFTDEALPGLSGFGVQRLVVETWAVSEDCGAEAVEVTVEITEETHRPPTTEDDLGRMLRRAGELGLDPKGLVLSCDDYASVRDPELGLDFGALLTLLTRLLQTRAVEALEAGANGVVLYGGAVHNDVAPEPGTEAYSYAAELHKASAGRYVEVDLLQRSQMRENPDYAAWKDLADSSPGKVLMVRRSKRSWLVLLSSRQAAP
jgi:hypothetical protein